MHGGELALVGAVDVGRPDLGGAIELPDRVGHALEAVVDAEPLDPAQPGRHLLDGATVGRDPEEMRGPADPCREVQVVAVRRPLGRAGVEVEGGREVDGIAARCGPHVQVPWSTVIELALDDVVRAEGANVGDPLAIRREAHAGIGEAVVGEPREPAAHVDREEVGARILQLAEDVLVRAEEEGAPVRAPGHASRSEPEAGELAGLSRAVGRLEEDLRAGRRTAIGKRKVLTVLHEGVPVELHALEAVGVPLLERGQVRCLGQGPGDVSDHGAPPSVRAQSAGGGVLRGRRGGLAEPLGIDHPAVARFVLDAKPAPLDPARARHVSALVPHPFRLSGAVRPRDPGLLEGRVVLLHRAGDGVGDPAPVRGDPRRAHGLDRVVVLELEGATGLGQDRLGSDRDRGEGEGEGSEGGQASHGTPPGRMA